MEITDTSFLGTCQKKKEKKTFFKCETVGSIIFFIYDYYFLHTVYENKKKEKKRELEEKSIADK